MNDTLPMTVVMPCFNAGRFVKAAVESVLNQNYGGKLQLVVVDDCSTDDSFDVVRTLLDAYQGPVETLLLHNEVNMGVAATVDVAVSHARYDWIVEADADDVQLPTRCSDTAELISRYPSARMVVLSSVNVDESGHPYGNTSYCMQDYEKSPDTLFLDSAESRALNYVWEGDGPKVSMFGSCAAFHRSVCERWGKLTNEHGKRIAQDPPLELRCFLGHPVVGSKKLACYYRCHSGNLLNRARDWNTLSAWLDNERFHARYHEFNCATYESMLCDLQRAMVEHGLTDWRAELLEKTREMLQKACYTSGVVSKWWNMNMLQRLLWWNSSRDKVAHNMRPWFRNRLLPFHLSCLLRFCLHRWRH